jgi:PAS domain S-box-containing protein
MVFELLSLLTCRSNVARRGPRAKILLAINARRSKQAVNPTEADVETDHSRERRTGSDRRLSRQSDQSRLRSIVEGMADGVVIIGLDGVIRFVNPAAESLFGRSAAELTGTSFGFPAVAGETAEIQVVRPGGVSVAAELRVVEMRWEGAPGCLVSLRDVTDRKRAEERAAQLEGERIARAEAEATSQAKSEFLAMMSHELRTPLNAVIGYAELLDLGIAGALTPDQRHQISRILASGRHLLGLVNEVLDLAKVEAGRLSLHTGLAYAAQTADGALAVVQPIAESRGILIPVQYVDEAEATYNADEDRVRQILINLLRNAVKFTEAGGSVRLECGLTKQPDPDARLKGGPWVYWRVTDNGIGIAPAQLAAIFDPFVQVERGHTRPSDGSGLGLTISRRLARLMRGDLTVRSEVGKGSAFTLWLPAVGGAVRDAAGRRGASPGSASRLRGLAETGEALMRELEPMLNSFVMRLRTEPLMPAAPSLRFSQLADHVGTYVANISGVLIAVEEGGGQPSGLIADGSEIQRLVAERHGAQRARLGWTADAMQREWRILGEEIEQAIRRRTQGLDESTIAEGLTIITRFIDQGIELSGRALTRALR